MSLQTDGDGLARVDIVVSDGRVSDILPAGSSPVAPVYNADGGQVWPAFADLHTHLDKSHILPRAFNHDGTIETARAQVRSDTLANWTEEDVEARFEFSLHTAYAHGTSAIRTHIDCFVPSQAPISFRVFRKLRDKWAGRIALQATALVGIELYDTPENVGLLDVIAESNARLGGITFRLTEQEDVQLIADKLERLFLFAKSRGLDVDLHVDENGSPASTTLSLIAETIMRTDFQGQVVCGHCCSLSVLDDAVVERTIKLVRDTGIIIVSLPLVNQFLQGRRSDCTPRWRGIPLLRELKAANIPVVLASDNCRDPYHPFGDLDLLEVFGAAVRMAHLDREMSEWSASITRTPFSVMGISSSGAIRCGADADLIIFRGRSFSELLTRKQADRIVIRRGRKVTATPPDIRLLDKFMKVTTPKKIALSQSG
jgi:cytosine deaminase